MKTPIWSRVGRVLLVAAVMTAALAAQATASPSKQAAKSLERSLKKRDLDALERPDCKSKADGARFACTWRAEGRPDGEVPFECSGRARSRTGSKHWRIRGCTERLVTLLPSAGEHPLFGYHENWYERGWLFDYAAAGGAQVARQVLLWHLVEPRRNDYEWVVYDAFYKRMLASGIRPLWVLYGPPAWTTSAPPSAGPDWQNYPPKAEYFAEAAEFMALAAQRYPESAGFEVWNEPNYTRFWKPYPDPEAYGQMTAQIANAMHAAAPGMPVISAGMAPVGNDGEEGIAYDDFLRRAYATGGPQLTDAIGTHPYPLGNAETDYLGSIRSHLYRVLDVMNDFGEPNKPIWVTEVGVSNYEDARGFTNREQAKALVEIYNQFRRIANLPVVVFHRFKDDPHGGGKEPGYGVVDGNDQAKPAFCDLAAAVGHPC